MILIFFIFAGGCFFYFTFVPCLCSFLALFTTLVPLVPFDVSHDLGSLPFSIGMHGTGVLDYVI